MGFFGSIKNKSQSCKSFGHLQQRYLGHEWVYVASVANCNHRNGLIVSNDLEETVMVVRAGYDLCLRIGPYLNK
jgi:hypothetical protein